jgi:RecA/RadA recombinase
MCRHGVEPFYLAYAEVRMKCAWLKNLWSQNYRVHVFVGRPGVGKTTAALHLVAYDLLMRGLVKSYGEALREAGRRLFLGRSVEELFEYILRHVDEPDADWLVIDDAAVGFHDFGDPAVWARFVDIIKTARNAIARRGVAITTTSLSYLSASIRHSAHIYYVKQMLMPYATYQKNGDCAVEGVPVKNKFVSVVEVEVTLVGDLHHEHWSEVKLVSRGRLAALIPMSPEFAMPPEVEELHVKTRKERVKKDAEEALERMRHKHKT